jgi:DNA-binding NarL/FixJ family response regulator
VISIDKANESKSLDIKRLKQAYKLTNREAEIAQQIFKGLKNAEIAKELFVSEITVKWHIRNIFEKLGVNARAAFIHKALSLQS